MFWWRTKPTVEAGAKGSSFLPRTLLLDPFLGEHESSRSRLLAPPSR
jgi:hypothetical protein